MTDAEFTAAVTQLDAAERAEKLAAARWVRDGGNENKEAFVTSKDILEAIAAALARPFLDRLAALTAERDAARAEVEQIVGLLQRGLQPAGSPPPGGPEQLVRWIVHEARAEVERVRAAVCEAKTLDDLRLELGPYYGGPVGG